MHEPRSYSAGRALCRNPGRPKSLLSENILSCWKNTEFDVLLEGHDVHRRTRSITVSIDDSISGLITVLFTPSGHCSKLPMCFSTKLHKSFIPSYIPLVLTHIMCTFTNMFRSSTLLFEFLSHVSHASIRVRFMSNLLEVLVEFTMLSTL